MWHEIFKNVLLFRVFFCGYQTSQYYNINSSDWYKKGKKRSFQNVKFVSMWMVFPRLSHCFSPDTAFEVQPKVLHFWSIRPENHFSHALRILHVCFTQESKCTIKTWLRNKEQFLRWLSFKQISHLCGGHLKLCLNDQWVLGHPFEQSSSGKVTEFRKSLGRVLVVPNILKFHH